MKTDLYTKVVLTVIAFCLTIIVLKQVNVFSNAFAESPKANLKSDINYGLVPLNEDGTIDVNIKSYSDIVDVNIAEVGGWNTWGKVPVVIKENEDK